MNKELKIALGVIGGLGIGVIIYYLLKKKQPTGPNLPNPKNPKNTNTQSLLGKDVKVIPFGTPGTSGEQDYDGTQYDALTHIEPNINSDIDSKVPAGMNYTYTVNEEKDDWVYIFSMDSDDLISGWVPKASVKAA